jgi:hypothetical protein
MTIGSALVSLGKLPILGDFDYSIIGVVEVRGRVNHDI